MKKQQQPKPKPNIIIRFAVFLITLAMVMAALLLVVFHDQLNLDALWRWFNYRSLTLSDSGQAESFRYSGSLNDVFVDLDGDLLVCTGNAISLYSGSGTQYIDQAVNMASPAASAGGGSAVLYDAGGTELYVFRQRSLVLSMESEGTLLSARLNENGLLTVVTNQSGFRGVVTVYDGAYQPRAAVRLTSAYVMDAQLAPDGHTLALVTVSQGSGGFASTLSIYDLNALTSDEVNYDLTPTATRSLGGNVILELEQNSDRVWALGDRGVSVLDHQAAQLGYLNWSDRYLKGFSLSGDGFALALLGKYRAGSQAELMIMDSDGALTGTLSMDEQVLSIDAAGRYFAVLTAGRLDIYTKDMTLYSSVENTQNARKVLLRDDGTAILIAAETARLYIPS